MISNLPEHEQHRHSNGLGYVANTASVQPSVYVGPFALVYGKAVLTDRVRVEDFAQISGTAVLSGDVCVRRWAWLDKGTHRTGVFSRNERIQTKQERLQPAGDGL
jgi:acyl-[acyl carrier protein]--UDP-N-acetylglucosamine O-acyltransferase